MKTGYSHLLVLVKESLSAFFHLELISEVKRPTMAAVDMTWGMFILICALSLSPSLPLGRPIYRGHIFAAARARPPKLRPPSPFLPSSPPSAALS